MGARGNSGVILSQILRGMARALEGKQMGTATDLADAFVEAARAAYEAVASPVEGTILTVIREASDAAGQAVLAAEGGSDIQQVLTKTVDAAAQSVARTPALLAVLRDAGVVDAGGQGLFRLLQGGLAYNLGLPAGIGHDTAPATVPVAAPAPTAAPGGGDGGEFGFETMFLLTAADRPLEIRRIQVELEEIGESVLVAGDERIAKVHVHSERPDTVLATGFGWGTLSRVTITNLDEQIHDLQATAAPAEGAEDRLFDEANPPAAEMPPTPVAHPHGPAIVAVAAGDGLERALRSLGVERIVRGGQSANPSTGELLQAIRATPAVEVIVLPNNPNVLLAAQKAAELCPEKNVVVVPTRNVGEGIGAALALDPTQDAAANLERMTEAGRQVQTLQVVEAVRDADVSGTRVRKGQTMVLQPDDGLLASGSERDPIILEALDRLEAEYELLTLYHGQGVPESEAHSLAEQIQARRPGVEVQVVHGGQPHYRYLIAAE
jgi:DAK2 domain fusion protein YloV